MDNLTVVIPFRDGHGTVDRLIDSLPARIPVLVVDDCSPLPFTTSRERVKVIRLDERGYFSGAVNAGMDACTTDALILNQDLWFEGDGWIRALEAQRKVYATFGDGVRNPAWPKGYVQGTFMFISRDAWQTTGPFNSRDYPLWGSTCEWQLRLCRHNLTAHPSRSWRKWIRHEERAEGERTGRSITQALLDEPAKRWLFIRTPPMISVIVPCYNYGRFLPDAINSLIGGPTSLGQMEGQTFQSFEIVMVDDASTDNSLRVARSLSSPWNAVRVLALDRNAGTPAALNRGIEAAHGKFIHILSADDMREDHCLNTLYRAVERQEKGVAYGDITVFRDGERIRDLPLPQYDFNRLLHANPMPAGVLYRKRAWEEVGGYPEAMRYGREDWAFNIALGSKGWCGIHVGHSGNLYRREGHNRSLRTGNVHKDETSRRSTFSWHRYYRESLRRLYPELYSGERPMGCCGGRGGSGRRGAAATRRSTPAARTAAAMSLPGADGMVLLEYVGESLGKNSFYTYDGTRYQAGQSRPVIMVAREHVTELLSYRKNRRPLFQRHVQQRLPSPPVAEVEALKDPLLSEPDPEPEMAHLNITDRARFLADELGVATNTIEGTGRGGRIVVSDVRRAARGE